MKKINYIWQSTLNTGHDRWIFRVLLFTQISLMFGYLHCGGGQLIFAIGINKAEIQLTLICWDKLEYKLKRGKDNE